jgi:hypothetical protein
VPDQRCGDADRHHAPRERSQGARTSQSRASIALAPDRARRRIGRGGIEQRAKMTFKRLLLTLAGLLILLLAATPAGASESGGVPAQTVLQDSGGGVVAPVPAGDADPTAEAAQEDTPTTPEGEEQPDGEEPPETETTPDEEGGPVTPPGDDGGAGEEATGGFLPSTGFEVAALAAIGLGLLMAGGALWPTSSWPPPRDRLSRSTRRR